MSAGTPEEGAEDLGPQSLDERVGTLESVVDELSSTVLDLVGDEPADADDEGGPLGGADATSGRAGDDGEDAEPPTGWAARASAEDWRDLAAWVDWLAAAYDHQPTRAVLPCWPAHGGVVHELAALRTAWTTAATTDASDEPGDAMASWHESLLRPCLARLREDYQLKACVDGHTPPRPRRPTDRDLLEAALRSAASVDVEGVDTVTGELR